MSDTNDSLNTRGEEQDDQSRLLNDLKAMPRVSAPMDFSHHLSRRIEEIEAQASIPWWKRLFLSRQAGGFAIPGFAYGAATAVVVLIAAVYVVAVTDFEREMLEEGFEQPSAPVQEVLPEHYTPESPADPTASPEKSDNAASKKRTARKRATGPGASEEADLESQSVDRSKVNGVGKSKMEEYRVTEETFVPAVRGFLEEPAPISAADTGAIADSLRRLDSLRQLGKQKIPAPQNDPR